MLLVGNGRCKLGAETRGATEAKGSQHLVLTPSAQTPPCRTQSGAHGSKAVLQKLGGQASADASPDLGTRRRTTKKGAPPEEGALPRQPHLFLEWLTRSLRHLVRHLTRLLVAKQVI